MPTQRHGGTTPVGAAGRHPASTAAAVSPDVAAKVSPDTPLILFDGVCNLCHASIRFVADRDSKGRFRFAYLQSETGRALMAAHGLSGPELASVVLILNSRAYSKSTAALRIARLLDGAWPAMFAFIVLPRALRDAVYNFIGTRRYRWFGRKDACELPRENLRDRLIP